MSKSIDKKTEVVSLAALIKRSLNAVTEGLTSMAALLSKELKPGALAAAYHVIDKDWKKVIESQREYARTMLLELVEAKGEPNDKGNKETTVVFHTDTYQVEKRATREGLPDLDVLRKEVPGKFPKNFDIESLKTSTIVLAIDPDKVAAFLEKQGFTPEEVLEARRVKSYQLWVTKL